MTTKMYARAQIVRQPASLRLERALCMTVENSMNGLTFVTSCDLIVNIQRNPMGVVHSSYYHLWTRRVIGLCWILTIESHDVPKSHTFILSVVVEIVLEPTWKNHWQTDACHKLVNFAPLKTGTHQKSTLDKLPSMIWILKQQQRNCCTTTWTRAQHPGFSFFNLAGAIFHMVVPNCTIIREVVQTAASLVCK